MEPGDGNRLGKVFLGWVIIGVGIFVYWSQRDLMLAIFSALVGGTLLNNFIVLLFPNRVEKEYLRNVIITTCFAVAVLLILNFFRPVQGFLDRFGAVGDGFVIFLGVSLVLALLRFRQLEA